MREGLESERSVVVVGVDIDWRGVWWQNFRSSLRVAGLSDELLELLNFRILISGSAIFTRVSPGTDL